MKFKNYMGLIEPLDTIWENGQKVTVYPNGKVVGKLSGRLIRNPDDIDEGADDKDILNSPNDKIQKLNNFLAFFISILAILGSILRK
jgi:hypothetical protein